MPSPQRSTGRPFLAAPRPTFYFPSQLAESARAELERGVRRAEGVGLVVGRTGTGKSLLLMKLAEDLRDDFDVALLSGARICTRRALWQSILSEIGESYRGVEENDLRMSVVERVRGLAATCSGLVVLVDEAQTLPTRLIEELRLLTTVPTPLPAVHLVLAGTRELEDILAGPKLESLSQRIVVRNYLEPFDHAETCSFVRAQCRTAGLDWDARFTEGCDHAVFTISDGVPRLINQICDHALLGVEEGQRLRPTHIEAAWREIQRLPPPAVSHEDDAESTVGEPSTISFGSLDDDEELWSDDWPAVRTDGPHPIASIEAARIETGRSGGGDDDHRVSLTNERVQQGVDPFQGPDVEFFFDASRDPFGEMFEEEEDVVERYLVAGADDFRGCTSVVSREGVGIGRDLNAAEEAVERVADRIMERAGGRRASGILETDTVDVDALRRNEDEMLADIGMDEIDAIDADVIDADTVDSDMIIVEEDLLEDPSQDDRGVFAVRPADYRTLFARLRRG